jgi:hypothetical protein
VKIYENSENIIPENVKIISGIEFLCGGQLLLFIEEPQYIGVELLLRFELSQSSF